MKTKSLNILTINRLLCERFGYTSKSSAEVLADAPYLLFDDTYIIPCYSNKEFNMCDNKIMTEENILKLKPFSIIKLESEIEKTVRKLVAKLNSDKYIKIEGYNVVWDFSENPHRPGVICFYPISIGSSGSITKKYMKLIMELMDEFFKNKDYSFGYVEVNGEEIFETYTPCVSIYK